MSKSQLNLTAALNPQELTSKQLFETIAELFKPSELHAELQSSKHPSCTVVPPRPSAIRSMHI